MSDESTNVDVSTNQPEPIEKVGGNDPVSFDDMEALMGYSAQKTEEKGDKGQKEASEKKTLKTQKNDEELEGDEPKPKAKSEKSKPTSEKEAKEVENADVPEGQEEKPAPKLIKFKSGDEELDLAADAKVQVKVNGQLEEVSVQDLMNNYSGAQNWHRKYSELDKERRTFEGERQELNGNIDHLYKLAITDQKPMEAVSFLADLLGGDGLKTVQDMQAQMWAEFQKLSQLSEPERRAMEAENRAKLTEAKYANQQALRDKQSENNALQTRISAVKEKYGMDDGRFREIYDVLKKDVKPEELTPELIGDVHERWTQMDTVDEIVSELGIEDADNARKALLSEWAKDRTLTKNQIRSVAQAVYVPEKKPAGSKLKDKIERNKAGTQKSTSPSPNKKEILTFDDL